MEKQYYLTIPFGDFKAQRQQTKHFKRMVRIRHGTIEPVFGNLINYYGLRKINVLGKPGAHKCMIMSAIAFNLKKLIRYISRKRNSNLKAMQREFCAFFKTAFYDFITSLLPHPNFLLSNTELKKDALI